MAEERIIDDEYGRGIKLRKTKDGFTDVTDELAPAPEGEEDEGEEVSFAYPLEDTEEDDEDLVGLSPEEAAALRQQKIEAAKAMLAEYEQTVAEGNALLEEGSFSEAEKKFEAALRLDALATAASVGYWRAKTENFEKPDVLIAEYAEAGIESLEYDLGYEAAEQIKRDYRAKLKKRYEELEAEEKPLAEQVYGKQERRREILKARRKSSLIGFACATVSFLVCVILAVVFGLKNFSTPDNTYVPVTIVFAALSFVLLLVFVVFSNRLLNACRIYATNERVAATDEGEELLRIRDFKDLYAELLKEPGEEEDGEEELQE